jgi:hypothetical protein
MLSFSPHVNVYLGFHLEEYMKQFFQLRKNILVVVTTACLIIPMILVSCDLIDNQQNRTGSLAFILSSNMNARTLVPGISLDAATYDLEGFGPEDASFSVSNISETSYVRYDLAPGEWTVIATARNSLGDAIASASATTTIEARKTSVVTLTCAPISGTGSLLLEVSWPVDIITEPELTATVVSGTGIVLNVPFTLETGTGSGILAGIPYGYHTVSIKLKEKYGSEKIVWGRVEAALILSDHPTTGSWELSQTDLAIYQTGGIEAKLGTLIPKPLTITLVDTFSQLQLGTSRTVSVAIPESNNFVQWYLNGDPITSATESTLTFGTDLMLGTYWLDVVVGKEDSRGSTGFRFEVKEASDPLPGKNEVLYFNDFSTDPKWDTNNSNRYFWDSEMELFSTENYTNSGDWATTTVNYLGGSFKYSVDIMPTERDTGDVCFGLFDQQKNSNSNNGEKVYVLIGGYSPVVYLYAVSQTGSICVSPEGTMQPNKWHSITVTYDAEIKSLSLEVICDNKSILSWSGAISGGFSSDIDYFGVSMNGSWETSGRHENAFIDNVKLFSPVPLYQISFDKDIFSNPDWTRTNNSVAVDTLSHVLKISPDGGYGDKAWVNLLSLNLTFPLVVHARMRLANGGRNYLLPGFVIYPTISTSGVDVNGGIGITYLPGDQYGWMLGAFTNSIVNPPPAEGTWTTIIAEIRNDGGSLYVQLDGQDEPCFVTSSSWNISGLLQRLSLQQPWDSTCELSYISVRTR